MFEAKSIYLGGSIIESFNCDYDSYKELGLTCPFCNSAVHLRKGSIRTIEKSGKVYSTRPYFSHYSTSKENEFLLNECERRVQTKEGRQVIEGLKIESKQQKLIFFQNHLLDIFTKTYDVTKSELRKADKAIGRKHLALYSGRINKNFYHNCVSELSAILTDCIESIDIEHREEVIRDSGGIKELERLSAEDEQLKIQEWWNLFFITTTERIGSPREFTLIARLGQYFESYGLRLHEIACQEVIEYLGSQSYNSLLFQFLIKIAFLKIMVMDFGDEHSETDYLLCKYSNINTRLKKLEERDLKRFLEFSENELSTMIILLISGVPWLEVAKPNQLINEYTKSA